MAFSYYSPVTINNGQVPSTQTDFPVLVSVISSRLKTTASGGHVTNANGYDIRPYTDSTLSTAITGYELERYVGSTGELIMWVKVSSLSSSTTPFVLAYGDSGITTDGSSATTWSNSFVSVYHLKDGTTLSVTDSVGNNNGTNSGTTATSGQIDGASSMVAASSQSIGLGSGSTLNISGAITLSCWVNLTSQPTSNNLMVMISKDFTGGNRVSYLLDFFNNAGSQRFRVGCYNGSNHGIEKILVGFSTGAWFLFHGTYTGTNWRGYMNGSLQDNTVDAVGPIASTDACSLGNTVNLTRYLNGKLDEARIATVARSDDWITTEYNNQFDPGTFETLGAEVSLSPIISLVTTRSGIYYSPISINAAQVPSTQTDFPVLVSVTDARFRDVSHGGHVVNNNGYDIRPYTDTTLGTAITGYELERYNPIAGEVIMWVKVASLSSSTTPIVLRYGDASLNTDGSSTATWSNSFLGVYHLGNGTVLNVNSATGSNNGTNNGATAVSGKIDGAANFVSASTQYIDLSTGIQPTAITLSAWINGTTFPNAYNSIITRANAATNSGVLVKSTGKLACYVTASIQQSYDGTGTNTLSAGTLYYITMVYDSAGGLIGYVNASVDGTGGGGSNMTITGSPSTSIGRDPQNAGRTFNGVMDEARVSSVARSANWITTEYNNQSAPATFETLGSEVAI